MPAPQPLRFQRPALPAPDEIERYFELARSERWYSNGGPCWRLLRQRLEDRVGAYCVPVASGTLGLMSAIAAQGDGRPPGGQALMPSFTFAATAQAAVWSGLQPVLGDVDADSWHLDADLLERALHADRDVALVTAVSAFGTPAPSDMRRHWEEACRQAGVPLIVDSAAGFGAVADDGVPIGAAGDAEVVSFHATKPFAIGEGGAVFTRRRETAERVEMAANFGMRADRSVPLATGLNAKMSELHAATALAVLDRIDEILATRRAAAAAVRARADATLGWQLGSERSTWQFLPVRFPDEARRNRTEALCSGKIEVRTYYSPLHTLEAFAEAPLMNGGLAVTDDLHRRLLCLPMANDLSSEEIDALVSPLLASRQPAAANTGT